MKTDPPHFFAVVLSCLFLLLAPSLRAEPDALGDFVQLTRLREQKKNAELIPACRAFLAAHSNSKADDSVHYFLGMALSAEKKYDEALVAFGELMETHPGSDLFVDAAMQRGEAFRLSEKLKESVPDFQIAWDGYREIGNNNAAHAAFHLVQAHVANQDTEKAKALAAILTKDYGSSNYARSAAKLVNPKAAAAAKKPTGPAVGTNAPDIEFIRLSDGAKQKLSEFRGKTVVLDFWASWCGPCQAPMAKMQTYRESHPDWGDKVELIALSIDNTQEAAAGHLASKGWNKTTNVWAGQGGFRAPAPTAYGISGIPTVYIIDADGKVAATGHPLSVNISKTVSDLLAK